MCYDTPSRQWWRSKITSRLLAYQFRDVKLSRFYSNVTPLGSSNHYEVTLPSGVRVAVNRGLRGLNIMVTAPVDPEHPCDGLCGNNNGNPDDEFGKWNTPNEFGEHWRIRTRLTLFDYKGNAYGEAHIDDGCDQQICVCSRGSIRSRCGNDAERVCFPTLRSESNSRKDHKGSGIGECKSPRAKRGLIPDDDTVDDQDLIPPFNPAVKSVNVTLTWPTPSGITKENVTQFCRKKIRYSEAGEACSQLPDVDVDNIVTQCISDIQATEDFSWATANFAALETSCIASVLNNISSYKNTTDGSIELNTDVLMSLCPNDCSDNGICANSTCICHEDYTSADCSISLNASPLVYDIRKSGLCDRRRRPCRNAGIFAFPLLDSENLTCHIQEYKVITSMWTPDESISLYPGLLVDLTEVKCFLPESPVNVGDYGNEGVTAAGLKIGVSNNRINVSEQSVSFITYDSVCQECNTTTGCKLRTDACLISGHCFAKNDSNPSDWCQQCIPELSQNSWKKREDNGRPIFTTLRTFYKFRGKELRVQLNAKDPENRTVSFSFVSKETFQASLTKNGLFSWSKDTKDSTVFRFNVTDECGAYSILNVSVIIKECPCKNSGECKPDYRFLDGAGKFRCSCPAEYTGNLCEIDVNECVVSQPCSNGRCINEQPGFSCSCFAGYTGDLCQNELNECASNPCFLGVSCTDMIAAFKCGPCPSGYTGSGEFCTKVNGEIDPCVKNPEICHQDANCVNKNGSFACQCRHGFTGDGNKNCTDVNECKEFETPNICHPNSQCSNTAGSFSCKCIPGYKEDGQRNCSDINECVETPNICDHNANCTNNVGSYSCECLRGFTGDGQSNCSDIDECIQSPFVCHENGVCTNKIGSYACHCDNGFFGDGKINCTENKFPVITTPRLVYGILNTDFKIQIEAQDPEGEDISFVLTLNFTTANAQITELGLLTIFRLNNNVTVHIRVEDKKGGRNFFILEIIGMACPCENNGKCYIRPHITYPVKKSDYICHCEEPYTGRQCESRPNPCGEQPCFPGLKCSSALNSEGFTCEKCPPLFEGDGKSCELKIIKGGENIYVESRMTLKNLKWSEELTINTTKVYRKLVSQLTTEIRKVYIKVPEFAYFIVKKMSPGSVVVDFQLIFSGKVKAPLEPLLKEAETGQLGNMTFEMNANESDADDDKDGSTNRRTLVTVIIVVIVALVVIIVLVVLFRVRRQRMNKENKQRNDAKAKGADSEVEGIAQGEEVPLKLFGDEAGA
ncbi:neurogenic locus notch homolog protein 2-like [Dendronephthya gigantea]|uniref:neurogenic locus notch homolog protein 2-like n=1 Tax=Dendronephthya gigantea TaxID=151771 RepID=UPI00106C0CFA|nr:neurogenic locus notch homolog protein 2-like [Dendronephthya gigantea]